MAALNLDASSTPLLKTKLYTPPVRPTFVPRPRLIEQLNAGLDRKLTLISALAGFGKATLMSEWAAGCRRPVVDILWTEATTTRPVSGTTPSLHSILGHRVTTLTYQLARVGGTG
jgi:hypothetical protein